jgi:hypothetical protein
MPRKPRSIDPDEHRNGVLVHKLAPVVRCIAFFADSLTSRDYHPGDEVPWTVERAKKYPQFVVVE